MNGHGITYAGEANNLYAEAVARLHGYYVRVTPADGEPFDAFVGPLAIDPRGEWTVRLERGNEDHDASGIFETVPLYSAVFYVY